MGGEAPGRGLPATALCGYGNGMEQTWRFHVVYKVDRLTRSLADFAKIVDLLDAHDASFVSVTQQFNNRGVSRTRAITATVASRDL